MSDNSSNNKRIAKNTVYLYARLLVSLCIGLYTSRAILDALGVTDYGIYNVLLVSCQCYRFLQAICEAPQQGL